MDTLARPRRATFSAIRFAMPGDKLFGLCAGLIVVYLVAVPLAVLLFSSVRDTATKLPFEDTAFTIQNYVNVFTSPTTYKLMWNTLGFALGSTAFGMGLGALFAGFLTRCRVPGRTVLTACVLAPLCTPLVTDAIAWALLASPSVGLLNTVIRTVTNTTGEGPLNIYSVPGMIFVQGLKSVPTAFILLSGPFARLDPALEEAALTSGATPRNTLGRITLPLLKPALLGGIILYLVAVLETFEIPAILGLPSGILVFASLIYDASHPPTGVPNYGLISAYASVFLLLMSILVVVYTKATAQREQFAVISGKGYQPRQTDLGRFTWVLVGLILMHFTLAVVLPFLALVWTSLGLAYRAQDLSSLALANFNSYIALFESLNLHRAAINTVIVAATTATGTMVLASGVAWLSSRYRGAVAVTPDRLTMLVFSAPTIVVGLALLLFYTWVPLPIYGTIWVIVIGLSTRFLSYCTRLMSAAFLQLKKELEEAAWLSGAGAWHTMSRVVVPLVWPSFMGGWLWVFVVALRDATLSLLLFTVTNDTLGVRLWALWFNEGKTAQAAALAVCLATVSGLLSISIVRSSLARPQRA